MDLTHEETQIVINLLQQITIAVKDAPTVLTIINKLATQLQSESMQNTPKEVIVHEDTTKNIRR